VAEAAPLWFLMEMVPDGPVPAVDGYGVHSFCLNNRQLSEAQNRVRRWSWGVHTFMWGSRKPLMVETQVFENPEFEYAACGGSGGGPRHPSGSCKKKTTTLPFNTKSYRSFEEIRRKQGLPNDFDLPGFTVAEKCRAVGNGVPMAMGRAMAKAVKEATE